MRLLAQFCVIPVFIPVFLIGVLAYLVFDIARFGWKCGDEFVDWLSGIK